MRQLRFPVTAAACLFTLLRGQVTPTPLEPPADPQEQAVLEDFLRILNTRVTSATRIPESVLAAPAIITVIDNQQMKERGYRTLFDVLRDQPGWDFELPFGGRVGEYPRLRGTRSLRQVLLLVDGVVQNNINDSEMGRFHQFPLHTVKRVEIITGPASAMYGANALLGVINLITFKPEELKGTRASLGLLTGVDEHPFAFFERNLEVSWGRTLPGGWGLLAALSWVKGNDQGRDAYDPDGIYRKGYVHAGLPVQDDGFDTRKDDRVVALRLTRGERFTLGADYTDANEGLGAFQNGHQFFANNGDHPARFHTRRWSAFLTGEFHPSPNLRVVPRVYFRQDDVLPDSGYAWTVQRTSAGQTIPPGTFFSFDQHNDRWGAEVMAEYQWGSKGSLMAGLVHERTETSNENTRFVSLPSGAISANPVFHLDLWSAYAQALWSFTDRVKVVVGGRYDRDDNELESTFHPRFGLVLQGANVLRAGDRLAAKFLYGTAFRSLPIYQKYNFGSNALLQDIHPERVRTYELETTWSPTRDLECQLSAWRNQMTDLYIDGTNAYSDKRLAGGYPHSDFIDAVTWGGVATVKARLARALVTANYTYTDGRNPGLFYDLNRDGNYTDRFEGLTRVSKHKAFVSLAYSLLPSLHMNLRVRHTGERTATPNDPRFGAGRVYTFTTASGNSETRVGTGHLPGYTVTDLTATWSGAARNGPRKGRIQASLTVSNLFGTHYLEFSRTELSTAPRYQPQPGRRIHAGISWQFGH